jgi:AraC family transcriptional regulator
MYLNAFPDLEWLKQEIKTGFSNNAYNGWPNVVLQTRGKNVNRPEIKGPLSIFSNLSGSSICSVNKHEVRINENFFFLSNESQEYSLRLEDRAETFNIHFAEGSLDALQYSLCEKGDNLADDPFKTRETRIEFPNRLYKKDRLFLKLTASIHELKEDGSYSELALEERMSALLSYLLQTQNDVVHEQSKFNATKPATVIELQKRIARATDYLYSYFEADISLDELSRIACLSKYHFLRLFKAVHGMGPNQLQQQLRLQKAETLLKQKDMPINLIALQIGIMDQSSFSRFFRKHKGMSPQQYQAQKV